jgi:antitoxin MazE
MYIGTHMTLHAKIQKWGNGLALRIGGAMREIPCFKEGTEVEIEITEVGFIVTKARKKKGFPFKESDLLEGLSAQTAHADLLAPLNPNEFEQ